MEASVLTKTQAKYLRDNILEFHARYRFEQRYDCDVSGYIDPEKIKAGAPKPNVKIMPFTSNDTPLEMGRIIPRLRELGVKNACDVENTAIRYSCAESAHISRDFMRAVNIIYDYREDETILVNAHDRFEYLVPVTPQILAVTARRIIDDATILIQNTYNAKTHKKHLWDADWTNLSYPAKLDIIASVCRGDGAYDDALLANRCVNMLLTMEIDKDEERIIQRYLLSEEFAFYIGDDLAQDGILAYAYRHIQDMLLTVKLWSKAIMRSDDGKKIDAKSSPKLADNDMDVGDEKFHIELIADHMARRWLEKNRMANLRYGDVFDANSTDASREKARRKALRDYPTIIFEPKWALQPESVLG